MGTSDAAPSSVRWADIAAAGGTSKWVLTELAKQGFAGGVDTSKMSDSEKKAYKARREEERRVKKDLYKKAWAAYRKAHVVHLGVGIFYHDTADIDRFDAADPERRVQENALPALKDVEALASVLELSIPRLRWLAFHRDVDSGTHYHRWTIPKRDGTPRLISAPKPDLKKAQKWIARNITEHLPVHGSVHGFLAGRSTRSNAMVHAGADILVKMDIQNFYPTITFPRVKGLLRKAGLGEQVATIMALLATDSPREELQIKGKTYYVATSARSLPQGAPTSPSITNSLCLRLDCRLAGLAKKLGCRYSRYADDLTFSWHGEHAQKVDEENRLGLLLRSVEQVAHEEGFAIKRSKTRIQRKGGRQKVTGLIINATQNGSAARAPRQLMRGLRAAIHNREIGKPGKPGESLETLKGWAAYIMMTDREKGRAFMGKIDALAAKSGAET